MDKEEYGEGVKKDELKDQQTYNELMHELVTKYSDELYNEVFLKPSVVFSSITIFGLEDMKFCKLKKKPWWLRCKYRIKDAWAVLVGKKEAYTTEEIDAIIDY